MTQFAAQSTASAAALTGSAEQIADPDLKAFVAEAQDLLDQRAQVTSAFIADWRRLSLAAGNYANVLDQALLQGNKAACAEVERGVQARTPQEVLTACNRNFDRARAAVEDKLKDLDRIGSGEGAPAE
jgi:hypothetical protein